VAMALLMSSLFYLPFRNSFHDVLSSTLIDQPKDG
jgi:hypothetical protein